MSADTVVQNLSQTIDNNDIYTSALSAMSFTASGVKHRLTVNTVLHSLYSVADMRLYDGQ